MPYTVEVRTGSGLPIAVNLSRRLAEVRAVFWAVFLRELDRELRGPGTADLRGRLPIRTGLLRRSIRVFVKRRSGGAYVAIRAVFYVVSPRLRAITQAWAREQAQRYVRRALARAIPIARRQLGG